jgi:hypothetical protein
LINEGLEPLFEARMVRVESSSRGWYDEQFFDFDIDNLSLGMIFGLLVVL